MVYGKAGSVSHADVTRRVLLMPQATHTPFTNRRKSHNYIWSRRRAQQNRQADSTVDRHAGRIERPRMAADVVGGGAIEIFPPRYMVIFCRHRYNLGKTLALYHIWGRN